MPTAAVPLDPAAITALIVQLGGVADLDPSSGTGTTAGMLGGLPVWWCGTDAGKMAATVRRSVRQGELGLLLGCDPVRDSWLLAATTLPIRIVLLPRCDLDGALARRIRNVGSTRRDAPLAQVIAFADALDLDAAGRRTFRELRLLLDGAVDRLPASVPRDDRHAWALAQLTRLLFLRFVESEGWLDGNPRFLATAFDRCLIARRDPMRDLMHPLFFGTLNRSWTDRSRLARSFGAIPFLNGGLFEPHAVERRHRLHLPADYWRDVFTALVDRVDVTLDDDALGARVTPEMLGRVFEGVMDPAERKNDGTFFTPPALVEMVLRSALAAHLAPRLLRTEASVTGALDDPDPELQQAMLRLTVLDPAAGSGAFLVGALHLLHGPGERQLSRVRTLVTRRLFGIDRNPAAVRVAELRLWLEVLRAVRGRAPGAIPPLPNLDATIRAGDALIDPLHGALSTSALAGRLREHHLVIGRSHGAAKRRAILRMRRTERRAVLQGMKARHDALGQAIAEMVDAARAPTLFGDRRELDAATRRMVASLRRERSGLRREARRIRSDTVGAPFALAAAFAPVFAGRGGFDLVVGNPPWVRAERIAPAMRQALQERYRWWRSSSEAGWGHLPDLAVAFIERGMQVLSPGGTLALLVPSKLTTAGYGAVCRAELASRATVHRVADLADDPRAGFDATTYPLALIVSRRAPAVDATVRFGLGPDADGQSQWLWHDQPSWHTTSPAVQRIARRLRDTHPPLGAQVTPQLGVKTGANRLFLDPPAALHRWCRQAIRGRDIGAFTARSRTLLLWPADDHGTPWRALPDELGDYFARERRALDARADQGGGPPWQLFRVRAATAPHRVVWRDLAPELTAAWLQNPHKVPLNSCYVAALTTADAAAALVAWLNAGPIRVLAKIGAESAAGGCARFGARAVAALPLPERALEDPALIAWGRLPLPVPQAALDQHVAQLLGLTSSERAQVDALATNRR